MPCVKTEKDTLMTKTDNKADWNSIAGKPSPKMGTAAEVDLKHADVKHNEPLGRVGIAPAKPVWPSKK
jgi:hypothetical protein